MREALAFFAEKGTDQVVMSALASALNAAGQKTVDQIKCGDLDQVIIKGTEGFVILQNLESFIALAAVLAVLLRKAHEKNDRAAGKNL